MKKVFDQYFAEKAPETTPPIRAGITLEDEEILQRAGNAKNGKDFRKLFSGDWSDYPSPSEADMAFCSDARFLVWNNPEQVDRLFRQSGLNREKWDRDDYRTQTIQRAIESTKEVYQRPTQEKTNEKTFTVVELPTGGTPQGKTHSEQIVEFLEQNRGERFKASEIGKDLGFSGVYVELQRLHESGTIFKEGKVLLPSR